MWELICHHTYKWAVRPVDISRYDNPAEASGAIFLADGVAKGSGALRFFSPNAHVRVYPGVAWNPLGAIKVELTVRLTEPSTNSQTLIEGRQFIWGLCQRREAVRLFCRQVDLSGHEQRWLEYLSGWSRLPGLSGSLWKMGRPHICP